MGLLGAIGAGIGAAGGAMAQMGMERLRAEIEDERMLRLEEERASRAEAAEIRKEDRAMGRVKADQAERADIMAKAENADRMKYADAEARKQIASLGGVESDEAPRPYTQDEVAELSSGYSPAMANKARLGGLISAGRDPKEMATLVALDKQEEANQRAEKRQTSLDIKEQHRYDMEQKRLDRMERMDAAKMAYMKSRDGVSDSRATAAEAKEFRATISTNIKSVEHDLDALRKENANTETNPGVREYNDGRIRALTAELGRYRSMLLDAAGVKSANIDLNQFVKGAPKSDGQRSKSPAAVKQDAEIPQAAASVRYSRERTQADEEARLRAVAARKAAADVDAAKAAAERKRKVEQMARERKALPTARSR